jgi:hypothetical protein
MTSLTSVQDLGQINPGNLTYLPGREDIHNELISKEEI